jgi:hypothetical protein
MTDLVGGMESGMRIEIVVEYLSALPDIAHLAVPKHTPYSPINPLHHYSSYVS